MDTTQKNGERRPGVGTTLLKTRSARLGAPPNPGRSVSSDEPAADARHEAAGEPVKNGTEASEVEWPRRAGTVWRGTSR